MTLNKYHWLMIILTLLIIVFSVYYPLVNYEALPERIPTHFNAAGEPDSWSSKNIANLLVGPIITTITLLILVPIVWWIARVSDPRKIINGPREKVARMSVEKAEEVRRTAVGHILFILLLVALLIMFISVGSIFVALGKKTTLGSGVPIVTGLLICDTVYLTWKTIRLVYKD